MRSGVSDTFLGPQGAGGGPWKIRLAPPCPGLSNGTPGLSEVSKCSPTGVVPRPTGSVSEGVRPGCPGSEGQNWRTAPPLASGHLNERSAPGGTGSPRSIFGRGGRNPEDREGRQRGEEKTDETQRERRRGSLKRRRGTGQHPEARKQGAWLREEEEGQGPGCAFLPAPWFRGPCSADRHALLAQL